jgi:iron complex outermembrane receptor protein
MKRIFPALLALASGASMAQDDPNDRMEHVIVSVPIHKKAAETALPVTIMSGEDLQRAAASTIGETLGNMPGIANSSFGPGVGRPVIRGQQGPRAITLQNGTSAADVSSLSPDHAVTVEPMLADSIEVLRGPATLLYGGGAIGGVVNVIDNRIPLSAIDGVEGALEYRYDDASDMNSGIGRVDAGNGSFALHLSGTTRDFDDLEIPGSAIDEQALEAQEELLGGEHEAGEEEIENTEGFIANTDGDADVFTIGGAYHFGNSGFIGFSGNFLETEYGIPPGAHGHEEHGDEAGHEGEEHGEEEEEENIRIDLESDRYDGMMHLHGLAPGIVDIMRLFVTYTDYEHRELEGAEVGTRFERETWETRLELVHEGRLHGVVGLQWRNDEFEAIGEEAFVPPTDSTELGLFAVEDFHRGDWQFELGGRLDYADRDPDSQRAGSEDFSSVSLSGSALWEISPGWHTSLALSRSARAPSTEELYSNVEADSADELVVHAATGIIEIGDPDLDEESSLNLDLSLNWSGERSWAELAFFYNSFEDYIFLLNSGEQAADTPVYNYSQEDSDFYGVEFQSDVYLAELGPAELSLAIFGDYIVAEFDDAGDVPRMPPGRIGAQLDWRGDVWSFWLRGMKASDQDDPGEFETETDGYTRWDAGVDYRWGLSSERELFAFLKWKNIGDEQIRLSTSFLRNVAPQAGESVEAGIRLSF